MSSEDISNGKIKPLTVIIDTKIWDKFKVIAKAKSKTLNDYVCDLIKEEVNSKQALVDALMKS